MGEKKKQKNVLPWLWLGVILMIAGIVFENIYLSPLSRRDIAWNVQENIQKKQAELKRTLEELELESDTFFISHFSSLLKLTENDIYLFGFEADSLIFWNSNRIIVTEQNIGELKEGAVELPNSYALWDSVQTGEKTFYGFYPIQFSYRIENRFIKSYFQPELEIPYNSVIYLSNLGRTFPIKDNNGNTLFYLDIGNVDTRAPINKGIGLAMYLLSILALWLAAYRFVAGISKVFIRNGLITAVFGMAFLLVALIGTIEFPRLLNYSELFSPSVFAMPGLFKNLGLILIFSVLWNLASLLFHERFYFGKPTLVKSVIFATIAGMIFVEITCLYISVIEHSVINFQLQLIKEVDFYSLLAYLIFILLFGGWFFIVDGYAKTLSGKHESLKYIYTTLFTIAVVSILFAALRDISLVLPSIMATAIAAASLVIRFRKRGAYNFLNRFFIILFFSILGWIMFWQTQDVAEHSKEETLLGNLASSELKEKDPISEINLINSSGAIFNDYVVKEMVTSPEINVDQLFEYLRRYYLGEFWRKYDIQIVLCWPGSDLIISENEENSDCYSYFEGMLGEIGERINGSNVYYLDNLNGRVNYFIWLTFNKGADDEVSLFIDLETRFKSKGIGYPELLSDNSIDLSKLYDGYSFARYADGKLINYTGDYQYNVLCDWIKNDTLVQEFNGYTHRFYKTYNNELFVLSKPQRTSLDTMLFLVYLFLYLIVLTYIAVFISGIFRKRKAVNLTLAARISRSVIFILLLSFVLVGATSTYFNVRQYKAKQLEVLREKNNSVQVALDAYLGEVKSLKSLNQRDVTAFLQELSSTLYIDINLYNTSGHLSATSRPEVFQRDIISRRISPGSFNALKNWHQPFVLTNESLVGLNYLSAYQPVSNWDNELLGYVNLPYFISSDELSNDVTDFIVVLLNIYLVFVIIAVILTVLLTREITRPLQMIREKIASFRLQGSNEKIIYNGEDEVSQLVDDYNRLIDELKKSAEQLASTERSMAWRQMARQIAHEIKNPLTPMKLSIQHLQRARKQDEERFSEYFDKTTKTLVEQIDNLSRIASEFSSFSIMSDVKPEEIELYERAAVAVDLFVDTPNVSVTLNQMPEKVVVYADRKQLSQVFNNLIKNAIQSIPQDRKGLITVNISQENSFAKIEIRDNGKGISEKSKDKLFEPNFTTKSSGMGLGLAITKNIIVSAGGNIWFESNRGQGTSFYFTLPLGKGAEA